MRTLAPSVGMAIGTRGAVPITRSNAEVCAALGGVAGAAWALERAAASREKNASVVAAPAKNKTAVIIASGLEMKTRRSRIARRGSVVIGKDVAAPLTTNSPITAAYVMKQRTQYVLSTTIDAYARYSTTASASVDSTNR